MEQSDFIFRVVVVTLSVILCAVVFAMMVGLFDAKVDNTEIFKIIGPGFQTIIGAFVGILSSRFVSKDAGK